MSGYTNLRVSLDCVGCAREAREGWRAGWTWACRVVTRLRPVVWSTLDVHRSWSMFNVWTAVSSNAVPGVTRIYYRGHLARGGAL